MVVLPVEVIGMGVVIRSHQNGDGYAGWKS